MAEEAERVAIRIAADMADFTPRVKAAASGFGTDMKQIEAAATRAEKGVSGSAAKMGRSIGQAQQATRNLGYQISDISTQLSSGTSPFLILAQQGPQVANALDGAKGAVGKFASFLSGPWGAALLGATTLLGVFLTKHKDTEDSVDDLVRKLQEKARQDGLNKQATEAYTHTLEGQIATEKKLTEELDNQLKSQRELNREKLRDAETAAGGLQTRVATLQRDLKAAEEASRKARDLAIRPPIGSEPGDVAAFTRQAVEAEAKVAKLRKDLKDAQASAARAVADIRKAQLPIMEDAVAGALDPLIKATQLYTEMDKLENAWAAGAITAAKYGAESARLAAQLKKAQEAAAASQKKTRADSDANDLTPFIRPVDGRLSGKYGEQRSDHNHAGIDIKVPVGTGVKAAASGTVITAGTLPGYGNVLIVDHGRGTTTRYAHLSEILAKKGDTVAQGQVIALSGGAKGAPGSGNSKGPHLHYEVREGGRSVDPSKGKYRADPLGEEVDGVKLAEQAAEDLAKAQQEAADRVRQVDKENAQLDQSILRAREQYATSVEDQAKLQIEQIDAAQQEYEAGLDNAVAEYQRTGGLKGISEAEAKILQAKNAELANIDRSASERQRDQQIRASNLRVAEGMLENQLDVLQSEEGLATSQKDRRRIALAILDVEYQRLTTALEAQISEAEINGLRKDEIDAMRTRLANLQTLQANATQGALRGTAAPFEDYITGIRDTAGALDEQLEGVAVGSLQSIVDGLGQAAAGFTSLGDVARGVLQQITASLVKLAAQQVILKLVSATVGKGAEQAASGAESASQAAASGASAATAATVAQAGTVAAAWAPAAAAASLATLGANQGPAIGALISTHAISAALSAAGGALKLADGGPVIGRGTATSDSVPIWGSNGEYMIRAAAASKLGRQALDQINLTGELPSYAQGGVIARRVSPNNSPAFTAARGGRVGMDDDFRREMRSIVDDAVHAMPDVKLFPTLEPGNVLRAALNTPGGRKAMFSFVNENSGKFRSQLE